MSALEHQGLYCHEGPQGMHNEWPHFHEATGGDRCGVLQSAITTRSPYGHKPVCNLHDMPLWILVSIAVDERKTSRRGIIFKPRKQSTNTRTSAPMCHCIPFIIIMVYISFPTMYRGTVPFLGWNVFWMVGLLYSNYSAVQSCVAKYFIVESDHGIVYQVALSFSSKTYVTMRYRAPQVIRHHPRQKMWCTSDVVCVSYTPSFKRGSGHPRGRDQYRDATSTKRSRSVVGWYFPCEGPLFMA